MLGSAQGFLLSIILFRQKGANHKANIYLSLLIFFLSLEIFINFLEISGFLIHYPLLNSISDPFYPIYGPLIYLYTKRKTSSKFHFKKKYFLFFLPILLELFAYSDFFLESPEHKLSKIAVYTTSEVLKSEFLFIWSLEAIYNLIFILFAVKALVLFHRSLRKYFSDIDKRNFNWLKIFLITTSFLFLVQVIIISTIDQFETLENAFKSIHLIIALVFMVVGYKGLSRSLVSEVDLSKEKSELNITEDKNEGKNSMNKYAKSSLDNIKKDEILAKLKLLMEDEKPYLTNDLKLTNLAEALSISANHLSQILNEELDKNFYDFINGYRIELAKKIPIDKKKKHLTILAIAYEAGFNSKSTFNRVFKEITSTTPTKFRETSISEL